jgi:predicted DNA binding CopG/RHH family protein
MKKRANQVSKFTNEDREVKWWASPTRREFLKQQSADNATSKQKGSRLVKKLSKASSVQIALRLSEPDIAKAREIADRKGIGYQTLLKMLAHEGLQRETRRR